MFDHMSAEEKKTVDLAMGRIFGMMMRTERAGDIAEYERCRQLILNTVDPLTDYAPVRSFAPLPGWNFGSGASGVIE